MASVDWQKQTKQKAGAMGLHNQTEERLEHEHSNPDIDKSLTEQNYFIGTPDYKTAYQRMNARTAEVDKDNPPEVDKGADRTVAISLVVYCPKAISDMGEDAERRFFELVHNECLCGFFGNENVHGTGVHKDEIHTYHDKHGEEHESLVHSHSLVSAYAEWKEPIYKKVQKQITDKNGKTYTREVIAKDDKGKKIIEGYRERKGINGKHCETKARMTALNKLVDEMCRREFGVPYLTGEEAGKRSVEYLKEREQLHKKLHEIQLDIQRLEYPDPPVKPKEPKWKRPQELAKNRDDFIEKGLNQYTGLGFFERNAKKKELGKEYDMIVSAWEEYDKAMEQYNKDFDTWSNNTKTISALQERVKKAESMEKAILRHERVLMSKEEVRLQGLVKTLTEELTALKADIQTAIKTAVDKAVAPLKAEIQTLKEKLNTANEDLEDMEIQMYKDGYLPPKRKSVREEEEKAKATKHKNKGFSL